MPKTVRYNPQRYKFRNLSQVRAADVEHIVSLVARDDKAAAKKAFDELADQIWDFPVYDAFMLGWKIQADALHSQAKG